MFREVCQLIEDLTGFTKVSGYLQVGHRVQDSPERCILVGESGGGETNPECPDMANINIQIISRAKTYFQARDDCWTCYTALHGTAGWNLPNLESGPDYLVMFIEALAIPQYIGQDENGLFEFSVNFIFRMEEGSCTEPTP